MRKIARILGGTLGAATLGVAMLGGTPAHASGFDAGWHGGDDTVCVIVLLCDVDIL